MEMTATNQKEFTFKKGETTTIKEFERLFYELFNRTWLVNGKEYNLPQLGWKRDYNRRKHALGLCTYRKGKMGQIGKAGTVFISHTLLSRNLDKAIDFEDTIRHEIAHAIDAEIRGRSNHDSHWKMICREVGADDSRLHEGFLEKPQGKYTTTCPNCNNKEEMYRKPRSKKVACGRCCDKYANGRFDERFILDYAQNY